MKYDHLVDHCSTITGIHWPDSKEKLGTDLSFPRTGFGSETTENGSSIIKHHRYQNLREHRPIEIQVNVAIPETRTPSIASVQDIWIGADWNEKKHGIW